MPLIKAGHWVQKITITPFKNCINLDLQY